MRDSNGSFMENILLANINNDFPMVLNLSTPLKEKSATSESFPKKSPSSLSSSEHYIDKTSDQTASKHLKEEALNKIKQHFATYENINNKNYFNSY